MPRRRRKFSLGDFGVQLPDTTGLGDLAQQNPIVAQILGLTDEEVPEEAPTVIDMPLLVEPEKGGGPGVSTPRGKGGRSSAEGGKPGVSQGARAVEGEVTREQVTQQAREAGTAAEGQGFRQSESGALLDTLPGQVGVGGDAQKVTEARDLFAKAKNTIPQGLTEIDIQKLQEGEAFLSAFNNLGKVRGGIGQGIAGIGSLRFLNKAKRTRNEVMGLRKQQAVRDNFLRNKKEALALRGQEANVLAAEDQIEDDNALEAFQVVKNSAILGEAITPENAELARLRGSMVNGRWVGPTLSDIANVNPRVTEFGGFKAANALLEPVSDAKGANTRSLDFLAGIEKDIVEYDQAEVILNKKEARLDAKDESKAFKAVGAALGRVLQEKSRISALESRIERFQSLATPTEKQVVAFANNAIFTQLALVQQLIDRGVVPEFPPGSFDPQDFLDPERSATFIPRFMSALQKGQADAEARAGRNPNNAASRKERDKPKVVAGPDQQKKKASGGESEAEEKAELERLRKKKKRKKRR